MNEYKFVYHGNEIPFSEVILQSICGKNTVDAIVTISIEWEKAVNYALSELLSKYISNSLQA